MAVYQQLRSWSPTRGGYVWRISMPDAHFKELYMIIDDGSGKERRARRAAALEAIQAAVERGDDPGEVRVPADAWKRSVDAHMQERAA